MMEQRFVDWNVGANDDRTYPLPPWTFTAQRLLVARLRHQTQQNAAKNGGTPLKDGLEEGSQPRRGRIQRNPDRRNDSSC